VLATVILKLPSRIPSASTTTSRPRSINEFMWLDFAINMGLGYCMTAAAPIATLAAAAPPTQIFSPYTLCSIGAQNAWAVVIMLASLALLKRQSWYACCVWGGGGGVLMHWQVCAVHWQVF